MRVPLLNSATYLPRVVCVVIHSCCTPARSPPLSLPCPLLDGLRLPTTRIRDASSHDCALFTTISSLHAQNSHCNGENILVQPFMQPCSETVEYDGITRHRSISRLAMDPVLGCSSFHTSCAVAAKMESLSSSMGDVMIGKKFLKFSVTSNRRRK